MNGRAGQCRKDCVEGVAIWPTKTKKLSLESKIKRKKNIIRIEEKLGGDTLNEGDLDPPGSRRLLNACIASMCVVCSVFYVR